MTVGTEQPRKIGKTKIPPFVYPVMAWAPDPASGCDHDDATREILAPRDLVTIYLLDDLRLGWIFVDVEGRCWEAVSSRVAGRAEAWWKRPFCGWIFDREYRLVQEFEERPPMTFDAVRDRLLAAVDANRTFYWGAGASRRSELRNAKSLNDLVKSDDARAIERLTRPALSDQWLGAEGRCSRRMFLAATGVICLALLLAALGPEWPWIFAVFLAAVGLLFSLIIRRLHDIGLSGGWISAWVAFSMACAMVHDYAGPPAARQVAASTWQFSTLGVLGFLALWPGTRRHNRYGFSRRAPYG